MQRYKLVLGGTIAGVAGVLAFPTRGAHLTVPSATSGPATSSAGSGSSSGSRTSPGSGSASGSSAPAAGSGSPSGAAAGGAGPSGSRSATSADTPFRYGDMAVTVTVTGSRITNVSMATLNETDGRSYAIDHYAVPQLEQQVISAGSVNINGVSGATFTSQAFVDAVANALSKLGIRA